MGRTREEICLLKHELSYQCDSLTDEKRVVGVGRGGGGCWRRIDHFTVDNTEWITQRNSPFDFTEYVVTAKF